MKHLLLLLLILFFFFKGFAALYPVWPGKTYTTISNVPWESLSAGDTVLIYYNATPYKEKFVIGASGTESNPIVIRGVPSASGQLPIIEGIDATTRQQLNFWSEQRGIIKIGGTSVPADNASWIVIENLEIRSARTGYSFTDEAGVLTNYVNNSAGIFIEKGDHITIRNCNVHDCGNGIFSAHESSNIVIEHCDIYDNGIEGSIYEHNTYTESLGIIYQFNRFGPLRSGCPGNNLKDRSAGTVIRYNWIESGNRQLDLVESEFSDFNSIASYRQTFVYNNVLIEPDGAGNSQICHYGGDNGTTSQYRKGTLFFYFNTVVSSRSGNTTLLRLSTNDETADVRNNVIYVTASGSSLGIVDQTGTANLYNNWLKTGWVESHSGTSADVNSISGNIGGTSPGFTNLTSQDYSPAAGSALINAAGGLNSVTTANHRPVFSFASPAPSFVSRTQLNDIGAYSQEVPLSNHSALENSFAGVYPNPFTTEINLKFLSAASRSIELFDASGRKLGRTEFLNESEEIYFIPAHLPPGTYFLKIQENGKVQFEKVIKL